MYKNELFNDFLKKYSNIKILTNTGNVNSAVKKQIKRVNNEIYVLIDNSYGKHFSEKLFNFLNLSQPPFCKLCLVNYTLFIDFHNGYKNICPECSKKEAVKKLKKTKFEKYGDENYNNKESRKLTNLQRYGNECSLYGEEVSKKKKETWKKKYGEHIMNPGQSIEIQNKMKKTNLEKYGREYYFQTDNFRNTFEKRSLEKYGTKIPQKSKIVIQKTKETNLKKYGSISPLGNPKISQKSLKTLQKNYGNITNPMQSTEIKAKMYNWKNVEKLFDVNTMRKFIENGKFDIEKASEHFNCGYMSIELVKLELGILEENKCKDRIEEKILKYLDIEKEFEVKIRTRTILERKELDLYFPEFNLGIEYNGLMYHSYGKSKYSMFNNYQEENKLYHLQKTQECEEKGIHLIHIFENEWMDPIKRNIWKSIIFGKLGKNGVIYARKCGIKEVSTKEANMFLELNHLQGKDRSSIRLGLYYEDELVSLMTFGKSRYNKKYKYEIHRFCNKTYISVVGGASRIFKYFINKYNPESVITYADRRYSQGDLYKKLGFEFSHNTNPNYFYFQESEYSLQSRIQFQKHKLSEKLETFDSNKTEWENMLDNGYRRIWDCGNMTYIIK